MDAETTAPETTLETSQETSLEIPIKLEASTEEEEEEEEEAPIKAETNADTETETVSEAPAAEASISSSELDEHSCYIWLVINSMSDDLNKYTSFKHWEDAYEHAQALSDAAEDSELRREEDIVDYFRGTIDTGVVVGVDGLGRATVSVWPIVMHEYVLNDEDEDDDEGQDQD